MEKKRFPIRMGKVLLDIIMLLLLLMLYQKRTISMSFHEVGGLVLFGLFLIHNLLNRRWIQAATTKLFQKTTGFRLRISWIINLLLFLSMTGIIATGIMISKTLPIPVGQWNGAQKWHYFFAAVSIVLMGIHLGLHWYVIRDTASKAAGLPKKLSVAVGAVILAAALVWGGYSLAAGSFTRWIAGPFTAASFEKTENAGEFKGDPSEWENMEERKRPESGSERFGGDEQNQERNRGGNRGEKMNPGEGDGMSSGISIVNILTVIATYGSEMIVFAVLTLFISEFRKKLRLRNLRKE